MGKLSPSKNLSAAWLPLNSLLPFLLTVIPELVILVVTRDEQLLCLPGSFSVLFQILYRQELDSDLLLFNPMLF